MPLDRDLYKRIKAMNREKMADFLTDMYISGKEAAEAEMIDFEVLREEIGKIKGIGESRLNEIMEVIERTITAE